MPGPMKGCFEPSPAPVPLWWRSLCWMRSFRKRSASTQIRLPEGRAESSVVCGSGSKAFYRIRRSNWATSNPVSRKNLRLSSRALNPSSNAAIVPLTGLSR